MRIAVFLLVISVAYTCKQINQNDRQADQFHIASTANGPVRDSLITGIDFKSEVAPIFKARCSPCHFPGGKMYAKLPFDTASTIINNREGILRRIKDETESKKIREFLIQEDKN